MELKLYNTLTKNIESFKTFVEGKVKMYTCGPTVYNYAHIGNLRTYIFEDVLKRVLEYNNYDVTHVMNITDVGHLQSDGDEGEDKMKIGAIRENKGVLDIARYYEDAFINDLNKLNIKPATVIPRATDHIKEIIDLIKKLEDNGYTYISNDNVYFSIDKFENYANLSNLNMLDLIAGSRVEVDNNKRNPLDFVLWFVNSKYENHILQWESPWGVGFPGWHIECSAMAIKYLGEYLDIHCGGVDHIPVHHTNEIAQSEGALGHKWVSHWLHGEFLIVDNSKMSKSCGGFLTLAKLEENGYDPLVYRYYVLQSKYRKQLVFSYERLEVAKKSLLSLKQKVYSIVSNIGTEQIDNNELIYNYQEEFNRNINDDLNIANAITLLHEAIKDNNLNNYEKKILIKDFDNIFALNLTEIDHNLDNEKILWIEKLLEERQIARKSKDWFKSDKIRDMLLESNIEIKDTREGTIWSLKI